MKKLLISVWALVLSAGVSSASCILMPTSTNSDNVVLLSLVDSKETGELIQDVREVVSYEVGDDLMTISTGSCANTGDIYTDIMLNFISYTNNIHNFFIQKGYTQSFQKYASLYKMGEELGALVTAKVLESTFGSDDDTQITEETLFNDPWMRKAWGLLTAIGYYHQSLMRQRNTFAPVVETTIDDNNEEESEENIEDDVEENEGMTIYSGSYGLAQQLLKPIYSYIEGNENASILVTDYVDAGCRHCVTHFQGGAISGLMATFPNQIQYVLKPVDIGYQATYQSKAIVCAGELAGKDAYVGMYKHILADSKTQEESLQSILPTEAMIDNYASLLHINTSALHECINQESTYNVLDMHRAEAELFEATGTPATVMLNTLNNQWLLIDGKAQNEYYVDAVKALLK